MATHISSLNIESFRGLKDLKIDDLGDVNILVGDNNSGKTSILEAIQLLCEPTEYRFVLLAKDRNPTAHFSGTDARYLFNTNQHAINKLQLSVEGVILEKEERVEIEGKLVNHILNADGMRQPIETFTGKISTNSLQSKDVILGAAFDIYDKSSKEDKSLNVKLVHVVDHLLSDAFSELVGKRSTKEKAIELLRYFDASIVDILYAKESNETVSMIATDKDDDYIPLSVYGDGMKKALFILNAMISAENGVLLIDEFETSLHTTAMKYVFKFMLEIAKELNVQLFLTTHSIEAIDTLLRSDEENVDRLNVIRIRKDEDKMYAQTIDGAEALRIRKNYKMELRV